MYMCSIIDVIATHQHPRHHPTQVVVKNMKNI